MNVLVLNAGSSSLKSCLFNVDDAPEASPQPLWDARLDCGHQPGVAELEVRTRGNSFKRTLPLSSPAELSAQMLQTLWDGESPIISGPQDVDAVGHRVVHGGVEYRDSARVSPQVKAAIEKLSRLAPAHNPANLAGIEAAEKMFPGVPQIAVFDTAFHAHLPEAAFVYPGPYQWVEQGIRRYGFHGISHGDCASRVARILGRDLKSLRLITCHLGNGGSLAAIQNGRSVDTTMGFTPLEGVMMGTRSGSIDPGIVLHLLREGCAPDDLDRILQRESGLLGVSGVSSDLRLVMQAREQGNARAQLAFDVYVHRVRFHVGAMLGALGGLDAIAFTGGIGEHSAPIRAAVCDAFQFLGLQLDAQKNESSKMDGDVAAPDSRVRVMVIKAQEEWAIARECRRLLDA